MDQRKRAFELYQITLRYLRHKVTENLRKLYLDVDFESHRMQLTAFYIASPSELELELLDDIVTNSNAPIPDFFVEATVKLMDEYDDNEKHDFLIFAFFDPSDYDYEG